MCNSLLHPIVVAMCRGNCLLVVTFGLILGVFDAMNLDTSLVNVTYGIELPAIVHQPDFLENGDQVAMKQTGMMMHGEPISLVIGALHQHLLKQMVGHQHQLILAGGAPLPLQTLMMFGVVNLLYPIRNGQLLSAQVLNSALMYPTMNLNGLDLTKNTLLILSLAMKRAGWLEALSGLLMVALIQQHIQQGTQIVGMYSDVTIVER